MRPLQLDDSVAFPGFLEQFSSYSSHVDCGNRRYRLVDGPEETRIHPVIGRRSDSLDTVPSRLPAPLRVRDTDLTLGRSKRRSGCQPIFKCG
jgi:hypothetical protein